MDFYDNTSDIDDDIRYNDDLDEFTTLEPINFWHFITKTESNRLRATVERDRDIGIGLHCEHLPLDCKKCIVNSNGRKVCNECCDHSNASMGTLQWNGLTYCDDCCEHNFGHKNFIEHLDDGFDTCTLCWIVVGQHISIGCNPHLRNRKSKTKPVIPKITLTNCRGTRGRILLD